jgi:hypothetical protein
MFEACMTVQVTAKKSPINFSEMTTPGEKRRLARALLGSEWEKEERRIRGERYDQYQGEIGM